MYTRKLSTLNKVYF